MKKVLILGVALLLFSCEVSNTSSLSESNSSLLTSSSSSFKESESEHITSSNFSSSLTSSSSESSIDNSILQQELETFKSNLLRYSQNVVSISQKLVSTTYYLTEGIPLSVTTNDNSVTTHYKRIDADDIAVTEGSFYFEDNINETEKYVKQTFYQSPYFYIITDYESESITDIKDVYKNGKESEEEVFGLNFVVGEVVNIDSMLININDSRFQFSCTNVEQVVENGTWEYYYSITEFEKEDEIVTSIPKHIIKFHNILTIENNEIKNLKQEYANELYLGGKKTNWLEGTRDVDFTYGEYEYFNGTWFNPSDY